MKYLFILLLLPLASCRKGEPVLPSTGVPVAEPAPGGEIKGFFVLNEGNMGSNKASLDYFDYATGVYHRNLFAERNPEVARELGDVGNDLQIHGERLYAVINGSNLVEVMELATARHLGTVAIPNPRFLAFDGEYAYVSSYAGGVDVGSTLRTGKVVKVDPATLAIVGECTVGRQPEELVVVGERLFVCNSGGYTPENYDSTVSVIDLKTFTETARIEVAINLHRLALDEQGMLWVTSRGDFGEVGAKTFVIDPATLEVAGELDLSVGAMALHGGTLYATGAQWNRGAVPGEAPSYSAVDTRTHTILPGGFITDGSGSGITMPYGVAVNPETGEIFVTDAKNYVTRGTIHCYSPAGVRLWSAVTGDIPARIAFTTRRLQPVGDPGPEPEPAGPSPYIAKVLDYRPAPGQFVNAMPEYVDGDTQKTMNAKVLEAIGNNHRGMVSLGGFGGWVTVGFDHTIENRAGLCDFRVIGNALIGERNGTSEPGVVSVAYDANKNSEPDAGEWYEIAGSAHRDPAAESWYARVVEAGNDVALYRDYRIVYHRPAAEAGGERYIAWEDNKGGSGFLAKNMFHLQNYYPQWIADDELTFTGTRLPQNALDESGNGSYWVLHPFGDGYADNVPGDDPRAAVDIDRAVDAEGNPAHLPGVDFIRIHTGVNQQCGWTGETSTEVVSVEDLHLLGVEIRP